MLRKRASFVMLSSFNRLLKNYCGGRLRRCAVLGILVYRLAHSGSCAPCALQPTVLATFFNNLLAAQGVTTVALTPAVTSL